MIRPRFFLLIIDLLLAYFCFASACVLRFGSHEGIEMLSNGGQFRVVCYLIAIAFTTYFFELYDIQKFKDQVYVVRRALFAVATAFFLLSALFYLLPSLQFGRGILLISLLFTLGCQILFRLLIRRFTRASRFASRILIVGVGELAQKVAEIVPQDLNPHSYVGFVSCGKGKIVVPAERIVGSIKDLGNLIHDYRPHKLIVALSDRRGALPLKDIMHSKLRGVEVFDAPAYYEQQTGCLLVEDIQPSTFIYTDGFRMTPFMRSYKRIFDVIFSVIGLSLAGPFLPFVYLAIKLDSPGPALFKQLRVGEREVEYFVYKFRTMRQDAEKESGAVWAQPDDPRVTRIGQLMRRSRIDEIPQLFNVLKGDMSFIGPRPERLAFVERLKKTIPYYSTRHFVKPGVTGWAQVSYPYGASEEDALEKLRYDLFYIKNYSIFLDFRIIVDTVKVVVSGFGGR